MSSAPVRTCVACRGTGLKPGLLRLVVDGGRVTPDPAAIRPGRGAYVCSPECLERALRRDAAILRRALRNPTATADPAVLAGAITSTTGASTEFEAGRPPHDRGPRRQGDA